MGKGKILSGGENGQYQIEIIRDTRRARNEIDSLNTQITELTTTTIPNLTTAYNNASGVEKIAEQNLNQAITDFNDEKISQSELQQFTITHNQAKLNTIQARNNLNFTKLKKASMEKRVTLLEGILDNDEISAWCVDLTEDLSGEIATIEIPGERQSVLIRPGYNGRATYNTERDGALQPVLSGTPANSFYNAAIFPGWQRWRPQYRIGRITAISGDQITCTVKLYKAISTAQSLNVNPESNVLSGVTFEYMECDGVIFEVGDEVVVEFTNRDWAQPKVIGYTGNPKACSYTFYLRPTIDGNTLTRGGQQFSVSYKKKGESEWTETDRKAVHGKQSEPVDTKKYGICGPFELEAWDQGTVKINLYYQKDTTAMDPAGVTEATISGVTMKNLDYTFSYYKEDESGAIRHYYRQWKTYNNESNDDSGRNSGPCTGVIPVPPPPPIQYWYCERINFGMCTGADPNPPGEGGWFYYGGGIYHLIIMGDKKYTRITDLYKSFTKAQLLTNMTSEEVYNWDEGEFCQNQNVFTYDFTYNLKQVKYAFPEIYLPGETIDTRYYEDSTTTDQYLDGNYGVGSFEALLIRWLDYGGSEWEGECTNILAGGPAIAGTHEFVSGPDSVGYACYPWEIQPGGYQVKNIKGLFTDGADAKQFLLLASDTPPAPGEDPTFAAQMPDTVTNLDLERVFESHTYWWYDDTPGQQGWYCDITPATPITYEGLELTYDDMDEEYY